MSVFGRPRLKLGSWVLVAVPICSLIAACSTTNPPTSLRTHHSTTTTTAAPTSTMPASPTTSAPPGEKTRVVTYTPWTPQGTLDPSLHVTGTYNATNCISGGVAGDSSYRCFTNPDIFDPCFARPGMTAGPVMCPSNPAGTDVTEVNVSSLPAPTSGTAAWAIQLASGQVCIWIDAAWSGLGPLGCQSPGSLADCHAPTEATPWWSALCQEQETQASPFTSYQVDTVWF